MKTIFYVLITLLLGLNTTTQSQTDNKSEEINIQETTKKKSTKNSNEKSTIDAGVMRS